MLEGKKRLLEAKLWNIADTPHGNMDVDDFIKELDKARKKASKEAAAQDETRGLNPLASIAKYPMAYNPIAHIYTPLTKKEEFEWLELFEENKKNAQELQAQIYQTEKEIDQMVYDLYGLTEVEIAIVASS